MYFFFPEVCALSQFVDLRLTFNIWENDVNDNDSDHSICRYLHS